MEFEGGIVYKMGDKGYCFCKIGLVVMGSVCGKEGEVVVGLGYCKWLYEAYVEFVVCVWR